MKTSTSQLAFDLPAELAAHAPPELRGLRRDDVRLMVSHVNDDAIEHTRFYNLASYLEPGDLLVVNASATINASLPAVHRGDDVLLHLSTPIANDEWVVELRRVTDKAHAPLLDASAGDTVRLHGGGNATLLEPFRESRRLWVAALSLPMDVLAYTSRYGAPIRYGYVQQSWPLAYYQTLFAREPGSAEMPSAARPFTMRVLRELRKEGVRIASLILHTGVSSLDLGEAPYPERYHVPATTADAVNRAHAAGHRVIAVGTTVVRALESVAAPNGEVHGGSGTTDVVITPERGLFAVDGLLTGLHAPKASHLQMLEAFAGQQHLAAAYAAAVEHGYRWHEFGDSHLILP